MQDTHQILSQAGLAAHAAWLLTKLQAKKPLVQNITNFVAMDISANVLLAIGASPAMVHAIEEVEEFATLADALVINTGTLSTPAADAMLMAAASMSRLGKPWVLDPVGAGSTSFRNDAIGKLLALGPAVIRGNASEIIAVAAIAGLSASSARPKGVDSQHEIQQAMDPALALARGLSCVVAATGATDLVTDGHRQIKLANGDVMMTRVTALGCALSALCAAFAAVTPDRFAAAASAVAVYGVAGQMAAAAAQGPGSFRSALLDNLHHIGPGDITALLRVVP